MTKPYPGRPYLPPKHSHLHSYRRRHHHNHQPHSEILSITILDDPGLYTRRGDGVVARNLNDESYEDSGTTVARVMEGEA
jgi:hypothetical protein